VLSRSADLWPVHARRAHARCRASRRHGLSGAAVLDQPGESRARRCGALARHEAEPPVPVQDDKRFTDRVWNDNPAFFANRQAYLAATRLGGDQLAAGAGDANADAKAELATSFALDALAPTNFLLTKPALTEGRCLGQLLQQPVWAGQRQALRTSSFALADGLRLSLVTSSSVAVTAPLPANQRLSVQGRKRRYIHSPTTALDQR
jgi:hypothetical protein